MTRRTLYRVGVGVSATGIAFVGGLMLGAVRDGNHALVLLDLALIGLNAWVLRRNWDELRAMRTPIPPVNVRLILDDVRHPVECRYDGFDGDRHRWQIIPPDWLTIDYCMTHRIGIESDEVAPYTAIGLVVER